MGYGISSKKGFPGVLRQCITNGKMVVGICGGYQMLGRHIVDDEAVESAQKEIKGLGFLHITTVMAEEKRLTQVTATCVEADLPVKGYEIHHGRSHINEIPFLVSQNSEKEILGCRNADGNVWGTYIHGVFDSAPFRNYILNKIRAKKKLPLTENRPTFDIDAEISRLAAILRENIDLNAIYSLI